MRRTGGDEDLLIASTLSADGGLPVAVGRLAGLLTQYGRHVVVVGPGVGPDCTAITESAAEIVRLPASAGLTSTLRAVQACRAIVYQAAVLGAARPRPIVHIHGIWTPPVVAAARAARRTGIPYVISPHGMLLKPAMRKSHWRKRLVLAMEMRLALAQARAVHCASDEEAEAVRHLAPAAHTRIIPFGVDVAQSTVTQPVNRPKIAGYLGRLTAIKNLETLVAAWADVRPAGWQLRIAGPDCDGTRARVQEMVRRLELNGIVSVDPPVAAQAVPKFLSSLAVFIQPSLSENFGMVVAEALAASTPVIATTGTPWHALADRGCGWCVAPSQAALAAAIRAATSASTDELAHMGRRGTDWIAAEYSWPVIAPRFLRELYELA